MTKLKTQYTQKDLETDWDKFAETDPMWAILRDDSNLSDGGLFTFMMPPEESKQYAEYRDRAIKNRHDNPLMLMYSVPTKQVEDLIKERGGKLLEKEYTGGMFASCVYWVTK